MGIVGGGELGREVRVGLVMYGGVSLAIYINGVAREFFEAVRGRGVYGLLKQLTDSDVTVDIIAGTSAGGINGVFLGHALAAEREFAGLSGLWREHADVDRLLEPIESRAPASLFQSEAYYQVQLEQAFADLPAVAVGRDEVPSATETLDLFVTGTDYHGSRAVRRDALGNVLETKDHRAVFRLKHRAQRAQSDLRMASGAGTAATADHRRGLATLCRLTSTFPAAFAPTHVPALEADRPGFADHLARWGALRRGAYFIDGGVLDNKPFTDAIEQIYYRTAIRPVARTLFYVEPDPESFDDLGDGKGLLAPGAVRVVAGALVGLPRYESIAGDLAAIDARNARLAEYARVAEAVVEQPGPPPSAGDVYWRLRLRSLAERVVDVLAGLGDDGPRIDLTAAGGVMDELCRPDRAAGAPLHVDLLRYDAEQALRRRFFVIDRLYDALHGADGAQLGADDRRRGEALLHALNRHLQVGKLLAGLLDRFQRERGAACVRAGLDQAGPDASPAQQADQVAEALERGLRPLLGDGAWLAGALATTTRPEGAWSGYLDDLAIERDIRRELEVRWAGIGAIGSSGPSVVEVLDRATTELLDAFDGSGPACDRAVVLDRRFLAIDARLFPIERLAGLREKDAIATVRISPRDARLGHSARPGADKVAGDRLGHFSGFLHRPWRSNDILWGRLDARCLLVQRLLDRTRIASVVDGESQRRGLDALRSRLDRWLPESQKADRDTIERWLGDLLSDEPARRRSGLAGLEDAGPGSITDTLVRASQDAVLADELPVLAAESGGSAPSPDPAVRAGQLTSYALGGQGLRDLPPGRLAGTLLHASLIARRILFAGRSGGGWKVRLTMALARLAVGALFWSGLWLVTAPGWRKAGAVVASAVLATALVWPSMLTGDDGVRLVRLVVMVLLPALYLLGEARFTALPATRGGASPLAVSPAPMPIVPRVGVSLLGPSRPRRSGILVVSDGTSPGSPRPAAPRSR